MQIEITLKNYRCFLDSKPARISLRKGFTAFVGANNSGKSSLLRFFYEFRDLFKQLQSGILEALNGRRQAFNFASSVLDNAEVFSKTNDRDLELQLRFVPDGTAVKGGGPPIVNQIDLTIPRGTNAWLAKLYLADSPLTVDTPMTIRDSMLCNAHLTPIANLSPLFQALKSLSETLYIGSFRNAINMGATKEYFDIQVGQAFIATWRAWKTGNPIERNQAALRVERDIQRIFELDNLQINPSEDAQTLQLFINDKSYKLHELGSGLTQFILVLANAATKQPSYILIDEPELNLHASLQLDFLTTLAAYAREGILFATHSMGLARASADRIYSFRRMADGESQVADYEATPRLSEFLGALSYSGYRELGFDKILLVEGPTDVTTIQQFLRLYRKEHWIVLLHLGGSIGSSSEDQLEEVKRISQNVSALIDSERDGPKATLGSSRQQFVDACKRAKIDCRVLERRAIENYFSDRAIKQVKGNKYRELGPYGALKDATPSWSKPGDNWRIARTMTKEEVSTTDLGEFLDSLKSGSNSD